MRKFITALLFIAITVSLKSQVNQMVSDSAYFVMEIDLGKVVKSVPLEEINKLEFVQSLIKQFGDESNKIKDLSNLGVDFSSKLIVFNLDREAYSSVSVIVPLKERQKFLKLFPLDQQKVLKKNGSIVRDELIISLTESTCIMSMVKWSNDFFREKTRIIFEENDWELPDNYYYYDQYDYIEDDFYGVEEAEETIEYEENYIEEEYEEAVEVESIDDAGEDYYEEEEIISEYEILQMELETKFQRIMDSITTIEKSKIVKHHVGLINNPKNNLHSTDELYRKVSSQNADAKIYMNPLMNINLMNDFMYYPIRDYMEDELKEMRQFAFINFTPEGIELDWKIQVSDNLGAVMKAASSKKLDKKLLKYIPDYAQGIALYNVNGFGAYEKFKEIYMPKLDESDNAEMLLASAIWSTMDEFIDVEAVASVYPPKILVSYAGFKEVELSRVTYAYDEESFEYTEVDTTYMEKIPMMTFVLSNERAYLLKKYLKAFQKLESEKVINNGTYYTIVDGPMQLGIPYYIAIKDDIIIVTNDESVVLEHLDGYSKKAFDRKIYKKAKKAKMFYAHIDFSTIAKDVSDLGLIYDNDKYMRLFYDKTGEVDVEMTSISKNQAHYKVSINTNEKYENGGYFLFELMNSIYLYSK
jgi:hypothetical protein